MPSDAISAIVDYAATAAVDGTDVNYLSLPALYRLFLAAYDGDGVAAHAAFTRYMQGQMPNHVLAYCAKRYDEDNAMRLFGKHHHQCEDPWAGATPREIEVREMLRHILINQEIIMSLETDALDELEKQTTAIDGAEESAEAAFTRLADIIANLKTNTTDPATAARITAASAALKARAARLGAAVEATPQA